MKYYRFFAASYFTILLNFSYAQDETLAWVSSDGQFRYEVYDGLSLENVSHMTEVLEENSNHILSTFSDEEFPQVRVRIWGNYANFLQTVEEAFGRPLPGISGYGYWRDEPELRVMAETNQRGSKKLLHEFAHSVTTQINRSFSNNPRWLWESIALYLSNDRRRDPRSIDYLMAGDFPTMQELSVGVTDQDAQRNVYHVGHYIGEYIASTWGDESFFELVRTNGDLETVMGVNIEEFESGWNQYMIENYLESN